MQPATTASVRGDFTSRPVVPGAYAVRSARGVYFITESEWTGKAVEHRVDYTLGFRHVQQYLTKLADGRIAVLPPTWDVAAGKWISDQDVHNPEEAAGAPFQVWNKSCFGCHAAGEQRGFDPDRLAYRTTWRSLGADCETCHGPGAAHVARMSLPERPKGDIGIVNPARLDPVRSTMVCAQCHSFRDAYAEGFAAGGNYYDYFLPVMDYRMPSSVDPPFWADGRPRWLPNSAVGLWQSQCFLKGRATCVTCHGQEHSADGGREASSAVCRQCHKAEAGDIRGHTHHAEGSAGALCVACHMPAVVAGAGAALHDHSMSIPAPENSLRHEIPNACNLCHRERDAAWAAQQVASWWPGRSREKFILHADAFSAARKADISAVPQLLQILNDSSAGGWMRANAAGYLGGFPNEPSAYDAVVRAFSDTDPLVRATAASALRPRPGQRPAAAQALLPLLSDPVATARIMAAVALVGMGVQPFPGENGRRFEAAKELYRARAALLSDDPGQQYAAGEFFYLAGDTDASIAAFRAVLKLDPAIPARYPLARALAKKGELQAAREILQALSPDGPEAGAARQLLAAIEANAPAGGAADSHAAAEKLFREGEGLSKSEYYAAALKDLEEAMRLDARAPWSTKAQVYRAVCLQKLARTAEAEAAFRRLAELPEAAKDADLQLGYVELLSETGRTDEALKRLDAAIAAQAPSAPALFWRAKLLLQQRRTDDAAAAAEQAVRLSPDLPQPHNLLVRIYQLQGRASDAAREAQWLRDYERRVKSR